MCPFTAPQHDSEYLKLSSIGKKYIRVSKGLRFLSIVAFDSIKQSSLAMNKQGRYMN